MKTWRCMLTTLDGAKLEVAKAGDRPPAKIVHPLNYRTGSEPSTRTYELKRIEWEYGSAYYDEWPPGADEQSTEYTTLKSAVAELVRCLSYERCTECGKRYAVEPAPCDYADHTEAYAAIEAASR